MSSSLLRRFRTAKASGERLTMLSLYDAPTARLACEAGVDALLIGDSMGNVVLGYDDTLPVTLDDIESHLRAVLRGVKSSTRPDVPVVADLPFGTYHDETLVSTARRLMQAGASALKLEGATPGTLRAVETLREMGVPVMGHLGYTPQSSGVLKGVVQARGEDGTRELLQSARELEARGAFGIVIEAVPREAARAVTRETGLVTIGIGAGADCDGQILVWHDLVGLTPDPAPRFVPRYAQGRDDLLVATARWLQDVRDGRYPGDEHSYS